MRTPLDLGHSNVDRRQRRAHNTLRFQSEREYRATHPDKAPVEPLVACGQDATQMSPADAGHDVRSQPHDASGVLVVRVPGVMVEDGVVEKPVAGARITTGLGLLCLDRAHGGHVRRPGEQDFRGIFRQVAHLPVVEGVVPVVLRSPPTPLPTANTEITVHGDLHVEPYLWGSGRPSILTEAYPAGWRSWHVISVEVLAGRIVDYLVQIDVAD